ncbi:MAG: alpha/beta hydrolase [Actinomycetota bacterium]|nr:alpha/beta hydrolase [Actinomycetota bacterium]
MPAAANPAPFDVQHPGPWNHRTISANGIHVHFAEAGSGPLVVLLHGFGQYWYSWRHQLPALAAAGFHAVAVDLRGHGDTDHPPRGYDAFTLSADTSGLIGALGERAAVLVGHGYGGLTAFNTAAIEPSKVRSVIALGAPHPLTLATVRSPLRIDRHGRLMLAATIPTGLERRLARNQGALLERWFRSHAGPGWKLTDDFSVSVARMRRAITISGAARASCEMLAWVGRSPWRADGRRHREALSTPITAPVVQLGGQLDSFVSVQRFAGTQQHCTGGYRQVVIPQVGHYAAEEAPNQVNRIIIDAAQSSS